MLPKTVKRFAFCPNEYIWRASGILEVVHMENTVKGKNEMIETIVGIAGIVVTVISIIVTLISIWISCRKQKHQKSNRHSPK